MSINSSMNPYKLQKFLKIYDELGSSIDNWVDVETIDISVNFNHTTKIINDIAYKVITPAGITNYNNFDLKEKYRVENDKHKFDIESINQEGRRTLLLFKEVL